MYTNAPARRLDGCQASAFSADATQDIRRGARSARQTLFSFDTLVVWRGRVAALIRHIQPSRLLSPNGLFSTPRGFVVSTFDKQFQKIKSAPGFIAALDQSGGSTPDLLVLHGVSPNAWTNEEEMYDVVDTMRKRMICSPAFNGDRIFGAILFENTMDREIAGRSSSDYLWRHKGVVPFLKVDKGMADEKGGVQMMKPMPELKELLARAKKKRIFGTKMRSVIKQASPAGVTKIVKQQFDIGKQIIAAGLVPIIEPEVDINCPDKAKAEELLRAGLRREIKQLSAKQIIMLKLMLPEQDGFYSEFVEHPNVLKVVAMSGGYSQSKANTKLKKNPGVVASFSRALAEGLYFKQSDNEFNEMLDWTIQGIYDASMS